ncbi:MAG: hypothetical protein F4X36_14085 [Gammaproteobacteria bacterium]|nr:hypothetical protein [Gammaproteobacteria bacterium]
MIERRGFELRHAGGRRLEGVVMQYGVEAQMPGWRERFAQRAFRQLGAVDVRLNLDHVEERQLARSGDGSLTLHDTDQALLMVAELGRGRLQDEAIESVRAGDRRGLSVEFRAIADRWIEDLREVAAALLAGIGVVRDPAYDASTVEARAKFAALARSEPLQRRPSDPPVSWDRRNARGVFTWL